MRTDDKAAADRLNSAWDSALAGRPDALQGLESTLADRVRAVHAMAAPSPAPEFVASLDASIRARSRQTPWQGTVQPRIPDADRTWTFRVHPAMRAAAVAAILLGFLAGFIALAANDTPNEPQGVQLEAAAVATPATRWYTVAEPSPSSRPATPIRFSECEIAPPSFAAVEAATPRASSNSEITISVRTDDAGKYPDPPVVIGLPDEPNATAAQLAGIEATLRELSACRFYSTAETGPDGRLFALFSESFRSGASRSPLGQIALPWEINPTQPPSVHMTRQLTDGRVLAVLVSEISYSPGNFEVLVVDFAKVSERWLIDEIVGTAYWGPAGAQWEQQLGIAELLLTDVSPGYRPVNGSPVLNDGWTYTLVLYNPEATERSFKSDGLGIDVTVPPYETRTVEFSPTAGEYSFETRTGDEVDEVAPPPCEGMPYPGNIMVVYAEPPLNEKWSCAKG